MHFNTHWQAVIFHSHEDRPLVDKELDGGEIPKHHVDDKEEERPAPAAQTEREREEEGERERGREQKMSPWPEFCP